MPHSTARLAPLVAAALLLSACDRNSDQPKSLANVRDVERMDIPSRGEVSDAQRLGYRDPALAPAGTGSEAPFADAPFANAPFAGGNAPTAPFAAASALPAVELAFDVAYELPAGWTELEPRQFRKPNLLIAGNPAAECYITILPGDGGGPQANIDRWLAQMGAPPLRSGELEGLLAGEVLGVPSYRVNAVGTFRGMSGDEHPDYELLGRVFEVEGHAVFVKATGPSALIKAEAENFERFVASLRRIPASPAAQTASAPVSAGPLEPGATLPAGHPPLETPSTPAAARAAAPGLTWTSPAGWTERPSSALRSVTFGFGSEPANEAYVIVLPGDAGGIEANVNRWLAQLGLEPISALQLAELSTIPVLGKQCPLIEGQGTFQGMSGPQLENAAMLATVCELEQHSVFIKLTGAAADVAAQREAFLAFCASLSLAP